jgi:hypothetical protein
MSEQTPETTGELHYAGNILTKTEKRAAHYADFTTCELHGCDCFAAEIEAKDIEIAKLKNERQPEQAVGLPSRPLIGSTRRYL